MKFLLVLISVVGLFLSDIVAVLSDLRQDEITSRGKRSTTSSSHFFCQQPEYPRDCKEVYDQCEEQSSDGVYLIKPEGAPEPFEVYCKNSIRGGGWTVFQRRVDGSVDFHRNWNEYKEGFGFLRGDFWLGNDKISYLTNQKNYELRIDLHNVNGQPYFARYKLFRISDEASNYRLVGLGDYHSSSTANVAPGIFLTGSGEYLLCEENLPYGRCAIFSTSDNYDSLSYHRNQSFSTLDRENDVHNRVHCATYWHGAWWFNNCGHSHLNGLYNAGSTYYKSIYWKGLPGNSYNLKYSEMKIRPLPDS